MDTKLRNFSTHKMTKITAFLLFVFCVTAVVWQILLIDLKGMDTECLFVQEYSQSKNFISYVNHSMYKVMNTWEVNQVDFKYFYRDKNNQVYSNIPVSDEGFTDAYTRAYYSSKLDGWIYMTFPEDLMQKGQQAWDENREVLYGIVYWGIAFSFLGFILLVFLVSTAGLKPKKYGIHLTKPDHIYSDILLACFCGSTGGLIYTIHRLVISVSPFTDFDKRYVAAVLTDYYSSHVIRMINISVATALLTAVSGLTLLSIVRKIKVRKLLKYSLLYKVIMNSHKALKNFYKMIIDARILQRYPSIKILYYRQQVVIAISLILTLISSLLVLYEPAFMLINILFQTAVMYWYFKGNNGLYNSISMEFNERLKEQMKAERMKVDLITNVSHDLKTPLTSIISYLELLSKEEGISDTAGDYVKILQDKSERLKNIVTDLFDLAKSTSGDIVLDIHMLDMKKLIEQTLADMEDRIDASGLLIKTNLPEHTVNINADGKKLYRVFQNVIDNALKYSMKGTRIFVDLVESDNKSTATIKNTAGYEIDFTVEEVLQRFTRGDKSRSTEGSGLGLSIAESFTRVCGGDFTLEIDGDMFKVVIQFNTISM